MINTNVGALLARTYATRAAEKMQTSMERLSSGLRINNAADDAAGLAVANKMKSQLDGIKVAVRNSQDGVSLVQTADGALSEISKLIRRMRELAVQMQNGIYTDQDRSNAQMEIKALLAEVNKIAQNTQYNKVNLLDGTYDQTVRAGNTNAETIRLSIGSAATSGAAKITGFAKNSTEVNSPAAAGGALNGGDGVDADGQDTDLKVTMGQTAASKVEITTAQFSTTFQSRFSADSLGVFSMGGGGNDALFDLDTKTGKLTSNQAISAGAKAVWLTYTPRASSGLSAHIEKIDLFVVAATEEDLDNIKVETTAESSHAIETLDKALEEVSTAQAKLGASQNRLAHNIDNLSKGAMLTEQSVGRIMDADFAAETAELSKQKILSQAATSMLAQANVSKQAVLALLR
ncbi:flagellin [Alphaproteobacteria bacterium]|nr:flagellin [Alphaproteobacteria bacterium]